MLMTFHPSARQCIMYVLAVLCHLGYQLHIVVYSNAQIVSSKRSYGVTYEPPTCITACVCMSDCSFEADTAIACL